MNEWKFYKEFVVCVFYRAVTSSAEKFAIYVVSLTVGRDPHMIFFFWKAFSVIYIVEHLFITKPSSFGG